MRMPLGIKDSVIKKPVSLLIIIALFLILGNILFSIKAVGRQEREIVSLEKRIVDLRRADRGNPFQKAMSGVESFKKELPDRHKLTKIAEKIYNTAQKNGLKIAAGDYRPDIVKETDISRYTISFPVEGHYTQIKRFIYDIETLSYPIVIEELILTKNKTDEGIIGLNIKISTYFL